MVDRIRKGEGIVINPNSSIEEYKVALGLATPEQVNLSDNVVNASPNQPKTAQTTYQTSPNSSGSSLNIHQTNPNSSRSSLNIHQTNPNNSASYKQQRMAEYYNQNSGATDSQSVKMVGSAISSKNEDGYTETREKFADGSVNVTKEYSDGTVEEQFTSPDGRKYYSSSVSDSQSKSPLSEGKVTAAEQKEKTLLGSAISSKNEGGYTETREKFADGSEIITKEPVEQSFSTESYTEMSNNGRTTDSPFAEQRVNYEQRNREKMMEKYNELKMENARIQGSPSAEQIAKYTEQAREKAMQDAMREAEMEAARKSHAPSAEQIAKYTQQARENARKTYGNVEID